jgi:predicted transcriptional regulator
MLQYPVTNDTDLPTAAIDHVSAMLTLAKQKHGEAMAMVGAPDANAITRLRQVLQLLEEAELLAEDAGSYVENDAMEAAVKELQQQQASIKSAIERLEKLSKRSPWVSPWPWIVLTMAMTVLVAVIVG